MSITSWHGWGQRGKVARAGWASGADDGKATRTPAAWMLAPLIWISFANLFPPWATSNQHKWIILAECRGEDEYFIKRKLYPNVDFYSGIIYQAMGFKPEMFTVLFAIPRTRLAGAVAGDARRSGVEDRAAAAGLHRPRAARVLGDGETKRGARFG